jgi:hypothetical protein
MNALAERIAFAIVAIPLVVLLEPWHLDWWVVDAVLGAVIFAFGLRDPSANSLRYAVFGLAISVVLYIVALLVARSYQITLAQLVNDYRFYKTVRRIPDCATAMLSYSLLQGVRSIVWPSRKRDGGSSSSN